MFWKSLLAGKITKRRGSEAIEEDIESFEAVISNLSKALTEAEDEQVAAQIAVGLAVNERDRIEEVRTKGTNFLNGLRTLLQD